MSQVEIKPSLLSYKLAESIAVEELDGERSITLKENYIRLIDQLQIDGVPKEKISTMGKQIIIERKKQKLVAKGMDAEEVTVGSWWRETARKQGCTDSKYSSSAEVTVPSPENTSMKTKPNIRFVDYLKRTKNICDLAISKFSESEDDVKDILSQKEYEILCHEWETVLNIAEVSFNEKTKAPLNTQNLVLMEAVTASSITDAARTFQQAKSHEYEKYSKFITSKQIGFIQTGRVPQYLPLFKPDSRDSAIFQELFGLACPLCNSWRTEEKITAEGNLICWDCDHKFNGKTVNKCKTCQMPLYKEDLLHIVKKGACPNNTCRVEIRLPDELSDYAQS